MLKIPTEFPQPGSYALLDGVRVRIISHRDAGDALVSLSKVGESITRTVPISRLKAPVTARPIFARKRRGRRATA